MESIKQARALDRHGVRGLSVVEFDTDRIVDSIIAAMNTVRLGGGIAMAASV
jgi:hypothetical protein